MEAAASEVRAGTDIGYEFPLFPEQPCQGHSPDTLLSTLHTLNASPGPWLTALTVEALCSSPTKQAHLQRLNHRHYFTPTCALASDFSATSFCSGSWM